MHYPAAVRRLTRRDQLTRPTRSPGQSAPGPVSRQPPATPVHGYRALGSEREDRDEATWRRRRAGMPAALALLAPVLVAPASSARRPLACCRGCADASAERPALQRGAGRRRQRRHVDAVGRASGSSRDTAWRRRARSTRPPAAAVRLDGARDATSGRCRRGRVRTPHRDQPAQNWIWLIGAENRVLAQGGIVDNPGELHTRDLSHRLLLRPRRPGSAQNRAARCGWTTSCGSRRAGSASTASRAPRPSGRQIHPDWYLGTNLATSHGCIRLSAAMSTRVWNFTAAGRTTVRVR